MKASEALEVAKALISDKSNWTQGTSARDSAGKVVPAASPNAVTFCATGALSRTTESDGTRTIALVYLNAAAANLFGTSYIYKVNDERGFEAVHKCYDFAISYAKEREAAAEGEANKLLGEKAKEEETGA